MLLERNVKMLNEKYADPKGNPRARQFIRPKNGTDWFDTSLRWTAHPNPNDPTAKVDCCYMIAYYGGTERVHYEANNGFRRVFYSEFVENRSGRYKLEGADVSLTVNGGAIEDKAEIGAFHTKMQEMRKKLMQDIPEYFVGECIDSLVCDPTI